MIVIKIKTWKELKQEFLKWVQAPRRATCKEYVNYMMALQDRTVHKVICGTCDKYCNMREDQINAICDAVDRCMKDCAKQTRELIDKCQPVKFF